MEINIKRFLFKGTALSLWVYNIIYSANYGIGLTAKYGIGKSEHTFFLIPFITVILIFAISQIGLYFVYEAIKSKFYVKILCLIFLMPTFLFLSLSIFEGLYEILFKNNIVMLRYYKMSEAIVWGIYLFGIVNLFQKNAITDTEGHCQTKEL